MARFPDTSPNVRSMVGSVYSSLGKRLVSHEGEVYPLHIGDTWMEPALGCRLEDLSVGQTPGMHRYTSPAGLEGLRRAIVDKCCQTTGVSTEMDDVLVTAGATGGLAAIVGALITPGDEVLILAPYWPLIAGIVRTFHGTPIPVPLDEVKTTEQLIEALNVHCSGKATAVYVSSPNNPSGKVFPCEWCTKIAQWATRRNLWLFSDEVYEDFVYGETHVPIRPLAPERTLSVHSFSKSYGMAGNRVGYVVGPAKTMREIRKVSTHTFYCAPHGAQLTALRALEGPGRSWVDEARCKYAELGREAASRVGLPAPQGSTFLWLDVAEKLDDRGLLGFLEDCAQEGLFVAPGPSFGPYPTHIRACFTAAPPQVTLRGFDILASLL
ncbi:MAG: pyridoxal phosphate-dependent aminotransferase [Proteobacteria bacterium]|nr:pyridoxal phosphate-dependent aminotransferase [Pseudomonadota bacterium]